LRAHVLDEFPNFLVLCCLCFVRGRRGLNERWGRGIGEGNGTEWVLVVGGTTRTRGVDPPDALVRRVNRWQAGTCI